MRIEKNQTICGLPAINVRDLLRRITQLPGAITLEGVAHTLGMERADARRVIGALERDGYVQRQNFPGEDCWSNTMKGNQLALATAAKPIRRATADKILTALLDRVREVNRSVEFAYSVAEVRVFGSYLTDTEVLSDIDVTITLKPRSSDPDEQFDRARNRIANARAGGRTFRNLTEEVCWPRHEVLRFLKSRSRSLSLHEPDDGVLEFTKSQILFP